MQFMNISLPFPVDLIKFPFYSHESYFSAQGSTQKSCEIVEWHLWKYAEQLISMKMITARFPKQHFHYFK